MYNEIREQAKNVITELFTVAKLKKGNILVVGCSSSEVCGERIGQGSNAEVAEIIFEELYDICKKNGIYLAAQCCEHLNRSIIVESEVMEKYNLEQVNVVPQVKAGGGFATAAYAAFSAPVAVEEIKAHAGIDIGGTFIGMHLKKVAVPVKLTTRKIGEANVTAARTRPKYIGGERARYNENIG